MEHQTYMHEIKNSLNAIYGIAQLLPICQPNEIKYYSDLIIRSVKNIQYIESDFNEYCKTGRTKITYKVVDINTLLQDIVNENKPMADKYNVNLIMDCKKVRVYTDMNKLKQAIDNIISNAIKYSNNGGKVIISCYNESQSVKIIIKDFGIGMTSKELKQISKPFYRSKKIERPGTGLGLCITSKLAKLLNWKFEIYSVDTEGTTVEIVLNHIIR
jgi:signal transduction histidine kinase